MKKKLILVLGFYLLLLSPVLADEEPEPYRFINLLPFDDHGWFLNAQQVEKIIETNKPKVIIEVGSWLGSSTRFMAERLPEDGKVYAVDTWMGSSEEEVHQKDYRLSRLYQLFLSNVKHAGLTSKIVPIRMKSLEAAKAINIKADLIYIDAGHDEKSVYADIMAWQLHLNEGGIMCGDDWYYFPSVKRAVILAANKLSKKVAYEDNFWWFE